MTLTDYLIDIALIGIVLVQVRGRRLTVRSLLLPIGIVGYVAHSYLHTIPTSGNDLVLIVGCAVLGGTLGGLAGRFTSVSAGEDGVPFAKAGVAAAALWILGTGGRLAFQVYATHGGGPAIAHFSATNSITSAAAWTSALILMALSEAVLRTGVLACRAQAICRQAPVSAAESADRVPATVRSEQSSRLPAGRSIMERSEQPV